MIPKDLASHLRHYLSFLAGIGGLLLSWQLIAPEQVAAANAAGAQLIEPLLVLCGLIAVGVSRLAMDWLSRRLAPKDSSGKTASTPPGGLGLLVVLGMVAACGLGLPSCQSLSGGVSYRDPASGATGGLLFRPGQAPAGSLSAEIHDPRTGAVTGTVDLHAGK